MTYNNLNRKSWSEQLTARMWLKSGLTHNPAIRGAKRHAVLRCYVFQGGDVRPLMAEAAMSPKEIIAA